MPQDTVINAQVVRKAASDRVIERNAAIQLCYVEVDEPDMHKPLGDLDRLKVMLEKDWGWKDLLIAPHLIPQVQGILRKGDWAVTAAIHRDMDSSRPFIVGLWPGLKNEAYGVACDIGSTTIAMHLVSLLSGRIVGSSGTSNPQIRFGEDLMSRVSYVMMNPDGREAMTKAVREAVNGLIGKVCAEGEVDRHDILDMVFVGNPIMHHLFLGIDPTELGQAPFALAVSGALQYWAHEIDIDVNRGARLYMLPCIAGHVGADAAGATLSEGPYRQDKMMLLRRCRHQCRDRARRRGSRRCRLLSPPARPSKGLKSPPASVPHQGAIERVRIDPETLEPRFRVIGVDKWSDEDGFAEAAAAVGVTGVCGSGDHRNGRGDVCLRHHLAGWRRRWRDGGEKPRRIVPNGRTFSYLLHEGQQRVTVTQNDIRAIRASPRRRCMPASSC
ncbi:ASKHA domain-containing protein [Ensifer canadensis]